jgi:hypothetical protein
MEKRKKNSENAIFEHLCLLVVRKKTKNGIK